jgi:hypothetical protein
VLTYRKSECTTIYGAANLTTPTELIRLCLPRKFLVHYVSSGSVALFRNRETFAEALGYSCTSSNGRVVGLRGIHMGQRRTFYSFANQQLGLPV